MKHVRIVVDMKNDFIDQAIGTKEAAALAMKHSCQTEVK